LGTSSTPSNDRFDPRNDGEKTLAACGGAKAFRQTPMSYKILRIATAMDTQHRKDVVSLESESS